MKARHFASARTAILWAVALSCVSGTSARSDHSGADTSRVIATSRDTLDGYGLRLGRAAVEQSVGNYRGVVENLEGLDYSAEPTYAETDRAAFLLAQAYLQIGSLERFERLARRVSTWKRRTPYTQWLAYQSLLIATEDASHGEARTGSFTTLPDSARWQPMAEAASGDEAATALAADLLLRAGDAPAALRLLDRSGSPRPSAPLAMYLRAVAVRRSGGDDSAALGALAEADTSTALAKDLVGGALIQLATRALARGEDASALLERVPVTSRYRATARHMLGVGALERGDGERGKGILESLRTEDSTYAGHREVALALAGQALEQGRWEETQRAYQEVDEDWTRERDALELVMDQRSFDALWNSWKSQAQDSTALILDALPARLLAERLAASSIDLASRPAGELPALDAAQASGAAPIRLIPPPPPEDWSAIAAAERRAGEAAADLERNRWAMARELEVLVDRRRYLGIGRQRLNTEGASLIEWTALLDSLKGRLDAIDRRLRSLRDDASLHATQRSARILEKGEQNSLWAHGMQFLYLELPGRERASAAPPGFPGPDSVLATEDSLAAVIRSIAQRVAAETPGLIARSYERAWRPGLIDRAASQAAQAARTRTWVGALERSADSSLAASWTNEAVRQLEERALVLAQQRDSLRGAVATLREDVAARGVQRALAALGHEREAIDYGLAASAYALSVRLDARDTTAAPVVVARGDTSATADDSSRVGQAADDEHDDTGSARWRGVARGRLEEFLAQHPDSPARAEMRFRLADLELIQARQDFREQMAGYLREQEAGRAAGHALPVLSHASSLDLYRKMLAEDRDFPHLDAVLFNAGMILADEANPEAAQFFAALVSEHPQSSYCQEAYLRMGDLQFDDRQFSQSVTYYARAGAAGDPSLRAIAFYKMGWAHFNEDHFLEAADAFRSVLDLYASNPPGTIKVDIESEANAYLVYSLAGAGGPEMFAEYFDHIGTRPYEKRILLSLGQHFRRYDQFAKATEADELYIQRYPREPDVLVSAQRLIETYRRSNRPALEREARLRFAPRFAPGGEWFTAQSNDSARVAGVEFAHASWRSVALEHHLAARQSGSAEDWREALRLYGLLLSTWPNDSDVAALQLNSGEASAHLGDYPTALNHYRAAAGASQDSTTIQALWQRVAVTDRWYESTRRKPPGGAAVAEAPAGSDSLAHAVIEAGDELLARFPDHPEGADIVWRQSQLGLAHHWYERASKDLGRMTVRYPNDPRTPQAASQRGDALFQMADFEAAGAAFEDALAAAQRAGRDSLARRAARAIPVCYYRQAEAAVTADSTQYAKHAALFERVASRWPEYEHADLAQYRAGLAFVKADQPREAVRVMQALIQRFPKSEYLRDAHLELAKNWEAIGDREQAANAYTQFATRYPEDESARGAWLKAGDLLVAAGLGERAEQLRLDYVHRFPGDFEAAMEILEPLARRELVTVTPEHPVSRLLDVPAKATRRPGVAKEAQRPAPANTRVAEYLRLAQAHPSHASRSLLAQLKFLQGEEAYTPYAAARLSQPLAKSIKAKQRLLDSVLVRYRRGIDAGDPEWAHASGFRLGEALVAFGEALERSERPADLKGDDLRAYEDVVMEQSLTFANRGEDVWSDLLRQQSSKNQDDAWIARARTSLWQRLATRFFYRPEVEFPLVRATQPNDDPVDRARADRDQDTTRSSGGTRTVAQKEGAPR